MQPFRLFMELKTPVIFRSNWPTHLDGLLAYGLFCLDGNCPHDSDLLDALLLRAPEGHYHASALSFGVTREQTLVGVSMNTVGRLSDADLTSQAILPNGGTANKPRYTNLCIGGPEAPRLDSYEAYHAPYVVFDGVGNGEACAEVLRLTLLGVGAQSARGFSGSVGQIHVRGQSHDRSIVDEQGDLARTIPLSVYQREWPSRAYAQIRKGRIRPPYHHDSHREDVVLPSLIRRVQV